MRYFPNFRIVFKTIEIQKLHKLNPQYLCVTVGCNSRLYFEGLPKQHCAATTTLPCFSHPNQTHHYVKLAPSSHACWWQIPCHDIYYWAASPLSRHPSKSSNLLASEQEATTSKRACSRASILRFARTIIR